MTSAVRVLTTRTVDSSPAILLVGPDGSKTLVNCGEGCQRSFLEHSQKLASVDRVCLTHLAHDSIGGLPGMILTSADAAQGARLDLMAATASSNNTNSNTSSISNENNSKKRKQQTPIHLNGNKNSNDTLPLLGGLELLGPAGTQKYVRSLRHFVRRDDFTIRIREGLHYVAPAISSEVLSKKQRNNKKKRKQHEQQQSDAKNAAANGDDDQANDNDGPKNYFGVQTIPISYDIPIPCTSNSTDSENGGNSGSSSQVVSFLFTTPKVTGKFLPQKAKELGIPPGPLYAKLKAGEDVTYVDAKTGETHHVKSSQVVLEPTPGMIVAILYYPSLAVWKALQPKVDELILAPNQYNKNKSKTEETKLELVIHMTPKEVFESSECKEWRKQQERQASRTNGGVTSSIQHWFLEASDPAVWRPSPCHTESPFTSACAGAMVRSKINSDIYKTPDFLQSFEANANKSAATETIADASDNLVVAVAMSEYVLLPTHRKGFVNLAATYLADNLEKHLAILANSGGAEEYAKELLKDLNDAPPSTTDNKKAQLLFTGTGSAIPQKHRNVTGKCLRMDDGQAILLDVGEGTVGQLLRASNSLSCNDNSTPDSPSDLLRNIKAAWISHPHADHHLGILRLLTDRQAALRAHRAATNASNNEGICDPIIVIGPPPILHFLEEYVQIDPRIASSYVPLDCRNLQNTPNRPLTSMPRVMQENTLFKGCITSMEAIPVAHCPYSYAVVLEGTSFGKVAYSGDCRPSKLFAQRALGADILIHEATFENGMEAEATMKRHSTVGEALTVAQEMQAKHLVLTHFSQRYPKIPPILASTSATTTSTDTSQEALGLPVIFAFDFMSLTPNNLQAASRLTPALRRLYPEDNDDKDIEQPAAMSIPGFFAQNLH